MKYDIYLFDFDYTLADSSRGIVICFRNVLNRHGYTELTDEAIKRTIGKTLQDSFSILTGITDADKLEELRKEYGKEANEHMTVNTFLFPETKKVLTALKEQGARIGIISTKYRYRIQEFTQQHFPDKFFDVIIGGEDVKKAKPSPLGVRKALRRLHGRKQHTLYIGDSTVDAETAQAAGVDFVGVLNGMTTREELAAYPHRQLLNDLTLLPWVDKRKPYRRYKYLPNKLIAYYRLIHQKQIRGVRTPLKWEVATTCKNCQHTYQGNYCPNCGQTCNTPRFTIRNAFQNILSGFFNIDNGFTRNLLEMLYRPGYMIRDYLVGKRVHYFKPFQTLFVLAALYIMTVQLVDPEALKKANQREKLTYETIIADLGSIKQKAVQDSTLYYIDQSLLYTDKAWKTETTSQTEDQLSDEVNVQLHDLVKQEIKQQQKANMENLGDVTQLTDRTIDSILHRIDSTQFAGTAEQSKLKAQIKRSIQQEVKKARSYHSTDLADDLVEVGDIIGEEWDKYRMKHFGENKFFTAVYELITNWTHGNKAFSILALLPIFTLATRWSFRKRTVRHSFNLTELFFAQVYIACQILWISLLILPFTGEAHLNDTFDLSHEAIFLLFVWDYRQLFNLSWMKSLWRTLVMLWYCFLMLIIAAVIIVGTLYMVSFVIRASM